MMDDNRQQRIEIMKSLIRQLHEGAAEDRIRRQLETLRAKADIDVGGHYSRPDVLRLLINRRPLQRVVETWSDYEAVPPNDGTAD